ncbi:MAG: bifunctional adenosylcobinamide kinase/adenosylcobinamide-phosphate guanylyltransferase [Candidatus Omnitrophica bacterium]|nr:bifunctional adenosylcobinamide kinase/adenosylcobinamide-phosphate guanylyltransferase [Candidatus Omnitrophota bacterium]
MGKIILVTGGARSGKTRHALGLGNEFPRKVYLATAQPLDAEMQARIDRHRQERDPSFVTRECPIKLAETLGEVQGQFDFAVVDCLTIWLSNLMFFLPDIRAVQRETSRLCESLAQSDLTVALVTNEVGMGIVPDNELSRAFRDLQGELNQKIGRVAHEIILMVSGFPVAVKGARHYEIV